MTDSFHRFVLDQLSQVAPHVRGKKMFGGLGIYSRDLFFALIGGETLYLKVDDQNRPQFEFLGSKPFKPFPDKRMSMSYYDVPLEVIETVTRLKPLVESAIRAAQDAAVGKSVKKRTRARKRAE